MWAVWWVWIVAGFSLGVLEILVPGYIFLGFAIGALIVGAGLGIGVLGGSWPLLLLTFALVSLGAWGILRRIMGVQKGQLRLWDRDIND